MDLSATAAIEECDERETGTATTMSPSEVEREAVARRISVALGVAAEEVQSVLQWREWRWMALLRDRVVLACPEGEAGAEAWRRLELEAELLTLLRASVGSVVPDLIARDSEHLLQVRRRIRGVSGHDIEALVFGTTQLPPSDERYRDDCRLSHPGEQLADDLGRTLAAIHWTVGTDTAHALGLAHDTPAVDLEQVAAALSDHVRSPLLSGALERGRRWREELREVPAVTQGDPHMFNLVVDPDTGKLCGLVDFDEARIAHRHEDLRYLHSNGRPFTRRAIAAYSSEIGAVVTEHEVERLHVLSAFHHFAFIGPDHPRFAGIVHWATNAVRCLAPDWV